MFKLMNFSGDDIRLDDKAVSEMITASCQRSGVYAEGVAVVDDTLSVICSDVPDQRKRVYRLSPLPGAGKSELYAELRSRYNSSFRTVGAFNLHDGIWLLVEKTFDE